MLGPYAESAAQRETSIREIYNLDPQLSFLRRQEPGFISSDSMLTVSEDASNSQDTIHHFPSSPPASAYGGIYPVTGPVPEENYDMDTDTEPDSEPSGFRETTLVASTAFRTISGGPSIGDKRLDTPTQVIQDVVDMNVDASMLADCQLVDLSRFELEQIPQDIADLRNIVFLGNRRKEFLNVVLSYNRLRYLPEYLFDVTNIRCLSLRYNDLKEIPPSISRLQNLRELAVSHNHLQVLPMELLSLQLDVLTTYPNPFRLPPEGRQLIETNKEGPPRFLELVQRQLVKDDLALQSCLLIPGLRHRERQLIEECLAASQNGRACSWCKLQYVHEKVTHTIWKPHQGDDVPFQARYCSVSCARHSGLVF